MSIFNRAIPRTYSTKAFNEFHELFTVDDFLTGRSALSPLNRPIKAIKTNNFWQLNGKAFSRCIAGARAHKSSDIFRASG